MHIATHHPIPIPFSSVVTSLELSGSKDVVPSMAPRPQVRRHARCPMRLLSHRLHHMTRAFLTGAEVVAVVSDPSMSLLILPRADDLPGFVLGNVGSTGSLQSDMFVRLGSRGGPFRVGRRDMTGPGLGSGRRDKDAVNCQSRVSLLFPSRSPPALLFSHHHAA